MSLERERTFATVDMRRSTVHGRPETERAGVTRRALDSSSPAEPDCHFAVIDDHGHLPASARGGEHLLEAGGILLDVNVTNRDLPLLVILTGG
jgi:hypothetical protein